MIPRCVICGDECVRRKTESNVRFARRLYCSRACMHLAAGDRFKAFASRQFKLGYWKKESERARCIGPGIHWETTLPAGI